MNIKMLGLMWHKYDESSISKQVSDTFIEGLKILVLNELKCKFKNLSSQIYKKKIKIKRTLIGLLS